MELALNDFDPGQVTLACTTSYPQWYPGERRSFADTEKIRGDLALQFALEAKRRGYHVVFSDWQSKPE